MSDPVTASVEYQRQLFALLMEVFERATGSRPDKFATFETFPDVIRSHSEALAKRLNDIFGDTVDLVI